MEATLHGPDGLLVTPEREPTCAVLVLAGSSGRVETQRTRLLARHGAAALSLRWFGDEGQPPGICEVPLETFAPALDRLAGLSDRVVVLGVSKGAEAALLLACTDPRVTLVVGIAPSSVVWANVGPGRDGAAHPYRSSWTAAGTPLPFVPYDDGWVPADGEEAPAYEGMYRQSLLTHADRVPAAEIPVERIGADVLLAAGGDDQVWPSVLFAERVRERRAAHGLATDLVTLAEAGHRVRLPGEPAATGGMVMARGGTPEADLALGRLLWDRLGDRGVVRAAAAERA